MNKLLKNVFLSVGMLVFVFAMFGMLSTNKAYANTCTVVGTGAKNWSNVNNWSGCGQNFPGVNDTVQIPTNVALTLDSGNASVAAVTFDDPAATSSSLTLGTYTLDVSGAVTLPASTGAGTATVIVGAGRLNAGSVSITGGASGISSMTVSTGRIDTTGNFTLGGASAITKALLTSTNTSTINIGGNFVNTLGTLTNAGTMTITGNLTGGGTVVNSTNASLTLNGATNTVTTLTATAAGNSVTYGGGAQTVIDSTSHTYYNLYLAGSGAKAMTGITTLQGLVIQDTAIATTGANLAIAANLIVQTNATLHLAGYTLGVGTTTDISGTVDSTSVTGTKTFTGLVTIASGGSFDLSGGNPVTAFGAGITNNSATLMNIGSGASTLVGNIGGTGSITWGGGLTVSSGTTTNSNTGTVTVIGTLALNTGNWTQATGSSLDLKATTATSGAGVLTTTLANTVTYSGGVQTILAPAAGYYNLILSGTGAKTFPAGLPINQTLTINGGGTATVTLGDSTSIANKLYFGTTFQAKGTWGAAASSATHKNATYFTLGVNQLMTITLGATSQVTTVTITTPAPTPTPTPAPVVTVTPAPVVPTVAPVVPATPTTPAISAVSKFTKALTAKSALADVKNLQTALNSIVGTTLTVDGKWGKLTTAAVKKFQTENKLTADGKFGKKSFAKLNALLGL